MNIKKSSYCISNRMSKKIYNCSHCKFITHNHANWEKHLKTAKHARNLGMVSVKQQKTENSHFLAKKEKSKMWHYCDVCGKKYRFSSGLSRHRVKCEEENDFEPHNITIYSDGDLNDIAKNSDNDKINALHTLLEKTLEKQQDTINKLIPKVGNTTNYNNMTINVFLNEKCQNAMNISEFMNKLNLDFDDIMYTKNNGYTKGITNIFLKNLQDMNPTERPIHCTDQNNLLFYIKDQNQWEQDNKHSKIDSSIEMITQRQIQQIKEWEARYPNWHKSEEETSMYMDIVKQSMGGMTADEKNNNLETIKKELGANFDYKKVEK